jgi:cytochrome c-type biogenesis protein CcmF
MNNTVKYIGEHLWCGQLGYALIILAFVSALTSACAYFLSSASRTGTDDSEKWKKLGKSAFLVHIGSVFGIMILLFSMMFAEMYEYHYVWSHVSSDLSKYYIFAAFWEGQEGSFLLWIFWHSVLGLFLLRAKDNWDRDTIPFLCLIQAFLLSMILGLYIPFTEIRIGNSPFALLRDTLNAPIFSQANYLSQIQGNGLNVLLQNYWMTIHPPTLFLGFASCSIPFCFAMGALRSGRHKEWLRVVQPWALFAAGILGTGILLGAAWAYEALSFNGYWAWDPVENMSLVPWLVLLAGIHSNMITRHTGRSLKSTYWFYIAAFLLVTYSTFLTRSGILGDSSAHAFTEKGLEWHLIYFIAFFVILSFWNYFTHNKKIPVVKTEEGIVSREFWMFIGAIVLIFSSILITFTTSLPVYNQILDGIGSLVGKDYTSLHRAAPSDPIAHYNKFQLWTTVFMALITGFTYFLRYKQEKLSATLLKAFWTNISAALGAAALATFITSLLLELGSWQYYLLVFAGWMAFFGNLIYFIRYLRDKPKAAGSILSHLGFGLMIIGLIASGLNKRFISTNPFTQKGLVRDSDLGKNMLIFKGVPTLMQGYEVTYVKDTMIKNIRTYSVLFDKLDKKGDKTGAQFTLRPNVVYDRQLTKIAAVNPSTNRNLDKDLYTHIASLPPEQVSFEQAKSKEDSLDYKDFTFTGQNEYVTDHNTYKLEGITFKPGRSDYKREKGDLPIGINISIHNKKKDSTYFAQPLIILRKEAVVTMPAQLNDLSVKIKIKEDIFSQFFDQAAKSKQLFTVKKGNSFDFQGIKLTLSQFKKIEEKDKSFSVSAILTDSSGKSIAEPVLEIVGNTLQSPKTYLEGHGAFISFTNLNPASESATFEVNSMIPPHVNIPVSIAENSFRSDYIVIEAVIFPGINFFWGGCLMMMGGLFVSMVHRKKLNRQKNANPAD